MSSSSQLQYQGQHRSGALPVPAPDDSDFLDSDDGHGHDHGHVLTEMEAELAAVATPATSQTTTATASARRRQRLQPLGNIMQMTHNFSFAVFDGSLPSADALNHNNGREAAGLPVHSNSTGSQTRHGRSFSGQSSSTLASPSRSQPRSKTQQATSEEDGPASSIAPHLSADAVIHWFSIDTELVYLSFFDDWGPLNIAMFYRFCLHLHHLINSAQDDSLDSATDSAAPSRLHLILYTSSDPRLKANAALLAAMYTMVCSDASPADAFWPLSSLELQPFRDAGYGRADYYLTIQDILYGVHRAISEQLLDLMTFDLEEYETYEQVQNGDWNWITPNIIAFASPNDKEYVNELRERSQNLGRATPGLRRPLNPTFTRTIRYFKDHGVKLVVRLNNPLYDARVFEREGIEHVDMYFDDGSNPSEEILRNFITRADKIISDGGVVAVHCKAGLGRTGVLIGAYLAYRHGFSASEAIGFMRIMRPGCVVGPQQHFMYKEMTSWMRWREHDEASKRIEQALAKQRTELAGKHRLSASPENSSNDTEAEVDISLGEGEVRHFKRQRKSLQSPSTPKREDKSEGDAFVHIAKPTPCVGQPRKSPSPHRKRMAQSAHPPATVGRVGSGSFSINKSRTVSGESARSAGPVARRYSGRQGKEDLAQSHDASDGERGQDQNGPVAMPSSGSRVLVDSPRVHNVIPAEVQAFSAAADVALEAAAVTDAGQAERYKGDLEAQQAKTRSTETLQEDELFVQGWKSPDPPSTLIKQKSLQSLSARAMEPSTPTSPGTPSRSAAVARASPHVREMFGLRDSSSGSNQNTPRSRKEAQGMHKSEAHFGPGIPSLSQSGPSSSNHSLEARSVEQTNDDMGALRPGPIEKVRSGQTNKIPPSESLVSSPAKSSGVVSTRQTNRVPSVQSRIKAAAAGQTAQAGTEGGSSATRKISAHRSKPLAQSSQSSTRPPSAASGSVGRVAAARERLAQRQGAAGSSNPTTDRPNLKRSRAHGLNGAINDERAASAPVAKRTISSSSRVNSSSTGEHSAMVRAALVPATSVATNAPSARADSATAVLAHVPRFAMGTASSSAKSTAQSSMQHAPAPKKGSGAVAAIAQGHSHTRNNFASSQGTSAGMANSAHLNGRNFHRRRSSLGQTDIVL